MNDAEYVKNELLEMVSGAMDAGLAEYVGFDITDGQLTAESYDHEGEVTGAWIIEIIVRPAPEQQVRTGDGNDD